MLVSNPPIRGNKPPGFFSTVAKATASLVGSPAAFIFALLVILVWAVSGPLYGYSDTWQLIINTGTTIVTFLVVFLLQNTQNRDTMALQLKLDELIRSMKGARNNLIDLENCTEEELKRLQDQFQKLSKTG